MANPLTWLLLAVLAYVAIYVVANLTLYQPSKFPRGNWDIQPELGASDVWLETEDGKRLHAWWIPIDQPRAVTLFLHGNAGNLSHRESHIRELTAAGSSVLILDYRGYGKSKGRPSEKGLYADAAAGYRHLVDSGFSPSQIVVQGESLGTAVAVELASRYPCGGVVLEAPFTSIGDMASRVIPVVGKLFVWGFDSLGKIKNLSVPILVLHGTGDEVVPFDMGRTLYEAAREPKWFWAIEGAGHNDIVEMAGDAYRDRLAAFYSALQ